MPYLFTGCGFFCARDLLRTVSESQPKQGTEAKSTDDSTGHNIEQVVKGAAIFV